MLQLLGRADLLGLNTQDDPRDQILYQGLQKLLVVVMICLTGLPMVFAGGFLPADQQVAQSLGVGVGGVKTIIFAQMFVGGILILFMDEIVSKWGVGSGVGLFIIAGVSQRLVGGLLTAPFLGNARAHLHLVPVHHRLAGPPGWPLMASDRVSRRTAGAVDNGPHLRSGRLRRIGACRDPLSNARVKGARGRFPVKLIYASVLPMILVRALQANIQFLGQDPDAAGSMPAFLGTYANGQPNGGLF